MPIILTQTDTAGECAVADYCDALNLGVNGQTSPKLATSGGTAGTSAVSLTQDAVSAVKHTIGFTSAQSEPNNTSWAAGDWVVRLEVTTSNMNLGTSTVFICRVTDGCANAGAVGPGLGSSMAAPDTTGVKSVTIAGTSQTADATDQMNVSIAIHNTTSMTQTWGYKPSQNIDTPVNQGGAADATGPILRMMMGVGMALSAFVRSVQAAFAPRPAFMML